MPKNMNYEFQRTIVNKLNFNTIKRQCSLGDRMKLLFEDLAKNHFTAERIQKFRSWIENANKARKAGSLDERLNQYDKAEELITFYTFAPLELREDRKEVVEEILKLANVHESLEEPVNLSFERQFQPSRGYLKRLTKEVSRHPVRYIREQGKERVSKGKRLETNTHVDVVIEAKNLLTLVEVKFTSDISFETTFNPYRNQLARTIDAGISEVKNKGKRLVVLLCSPSEFYHKKSRLYYYKIQEYSDFGKIKEDICWREVEEIKEHVLAVAWVPLEKVIEIAYRNFSFPELDEVERFFVERNLAWGS